jgi:uncharacterized protein YjbI with pentapeptide repeats
MLNEEGHGMANREHLAILKQGRATWNQWRQKHGEIQPDLSSAELTRPTGTMRVYGSDLAGINLSFANLQGAGLVLANLRAANLYGANLERAKLNFANLTAANLEKANLSFANLTAADLERANLSFANLVETNLTDASLKDCLIYGIAVWNVQLHGAKQENLVITHAFEPIITVDNLEVAQFIYLLLNNPKIRDVIDTIARKAVLILGRFTPKRKAVLNALREALRAYGYLPILFDFDKPSSQDSTETVSTLAHLSRFIIADLTDPSSIPYELREIVPNRMVPVQPLFTPTEEAKQEFVMFHDLRRKYHWVLPIHTYKDLDDLLASFEAKIIGPAEQKAQELAGSENPSWFVGCPYNVSITSFCGLHAQLLDEHVFR